ncbi:MAG: fibronectin type III domain-containing protein [Bacteroidales bacterium]|jgi:hypothetical protein|nr:fibronectin type III domain-containing protein [Bacteroidales bacterium]
MKNILFFIVSTLMVLQLYSQTPLNEGFENQNFPPDYWTTFHVSGNVYWQSTDDFSPLGNYCAMAPYSQNESENWLITPLLSVENTDDSISFWVKTNQYYDNTELKIRVSLNGNDVSSFEEEPLFVFPQSTINTSWTRYAFSLSQYLDEEIYIGFEVIDNNGLNVLLDDVQGPNIVYPFCPYPINIEASSITSSSAEISWTNPSLNASSWIIQYSLSQDSSWEDASEEFSNSTSITLNSLSFGSYYKARIKALCSSEESSWSNCVYFTTECGIASVPFTENFDARNEVPLCFTQIAGDISVVQTQKYSNPYSMQLSNGGFVATLPIAEEIHLLRIKFYARVESQDKSGTLEVGLMSDPNIASTFESIDTIQPTSVGFWSEYEFYFDESLLSGDNLSIAFKQNNEVNWFWWIDDILIDYIPSCKKPINLTISDITTSSADLSWTDLSSGVWNIQYMPSDSSSWDNAFEEATDTYPYTIDNLLPSTEYKVRVQSDCGEEKSDWTQYKTFRTQCGGVSSFPYVMDFEQTDANNLPFCWSRPEYSYTNSYGTKYPYTYNLSAYAHSGTKSMSFFSDSTYCYFISPQILENINSLRMRFWMRLASNGNQKIIVGLMTDINDTTTFEGVDTFMVNSASYNEYEVFFSNTSLIGSGNYIVFKYSGQTAYLDDVIIDNIPSCLRPTNISVDNVYPYSIDLSWDDPNSSYWNIQYMPSFSSSWNEDAITEEAYSNSFTISNLSDNTNYTIRIQSICGGDEESEWTFPINVKTSCGETTAPTLVEKFDSFLPNDCWQKGGGLLTNEGDITISGDGLWRQSTIPIAQGEGNCIRLDLYNSNNGWIITKSIDLGTEGEVYQVEFDALLSAYGNDITLSPDLSGEDDVFGIVVSTDNGLSWNYQNAILWTNQAGTNRSLNSLFPKQHLVIPLRNSENEPYQGIIKIALYAASTLPNADNYIYVDNFVVTPVSSCQEVSSLDVRDISTTQATISFIENGEATSWEYALTTDMTIDDPSSLDAITITENSFILSGLTPLTKYKLFLRPTCGEVSWKQITFTTLAIPAPIPYYCNFEDESETIAWGKVNLPGTAWEKGSAAGNGLSSQIDTDSLAMYISKDGGLSYGGTLSGATYSYTYRDIAFGENEESYILSYDWKCQGHEEEDGVTDGLLVFLLDPKTPISATFPVYANDSSINLNYGSSLWQRANVEIDNVSGIKRLVFFHFSRYTQYPPQPAIDNVSIKAASCPRPTEISVDNITTNTMDISFNGFSDEGYILSYGANSASQVDIFVPSSPYTITGLNSMTTYYLAVRKICDQDTSLYSNIVSASTLCDSITTFPFVENFNQSSSMPLCWEGNSGNASYPYISTTGNLDPNSLLLSFGSEVSLPKIGEDLHLLKLKFYSKAESVASSGSLEVGVMTNLEDSTTFESIAILQPENTQWNEQEVFFNSINSNGENSYIVFKQHNFVNFYWWIDNVVIDYISLCEKPIRIIAENPTPNSIDLSWEDVTENAYSWVIQYMPIYSNNWDEATTIEVSTNPCTISSLSAATSYKLRMKTSCGEEESSWSNAINFKTSCGDITSLPYNENFDNLASEGETLPYCWEKISSYNDYPFISNGQNVSEDYSLCFATKAEQTAYAIMPSVEENIQLLKLKFFARAENAQFSGNLEVGVLSDKTDTTTFRSIVSLEPSDFAGVWVEKEVLFDEIEPNENGLYITFKQTAPKQAWYWWIDDVSLEYISTSLCPAPTDLQINYTNTYATLSWRGDDNTNSYQVKLNQDGPFIDVENTEYRFVNLSPNTEYSAFVRTKCEDGFSPWQSISFTTSAYPPQVNTLSPTLISQFSARLNGEYENVASNSIESGFEYKIDDSESSSWERVYSDVEESNFFLDITNLRASTPYVYKAFINTSNDGLIYGLEQRFQTLDIVSPSVTTLPVEITSETSAIFSATVVQGTEDIFTRGFELKNEEDAWQDALILTGNGTSPFTLNYTSLISNQTYNLRAYVKTGENGATITYGNEILFNSKNSLIDQEKENKPLVEIYPNPAKDKTIISLSGIRGRVTLLLTDTYGRRIINKTFNVKDNIKEVFDVSSLTKGIYYVTLKGEKLNTTQKLIVK